VVVHPREVLSAAVWWSPQCWSDGLADSSHGGKSAPTSKHGHRWHRRRGMDGDAR
jgi:hypothetical protein